MEPFLKKEGIDYISNFYRYSLYNKEKNLYLLTIDTGDFIFLNSSALKQLKKGKIENKEIYNKLSQKGIIIDTNNFNNIVKSYKKRYSFLENGTSLHIVILTSRCNLKCTYCYASADEIDSSIEDKDLDKKTAKKIVDFILSSPSHAITIEFQGGEILTNFEVLKYMANYAKEENKKIKKDLRLSFTSNFTLMTNEIANWFIENNIPMCTSLDGPKIVHDKNRYILAKNNIHIGTYDKVIYWIKKINQIYKQKNIKKNVNALMTITKHSLPYYKEIIDEYLNLEMSFVDIRSMTLIGRSIENINTDLQYSKQEYIEFYEKSIAYIDEINKKNKDNKSNFQITERLRKVYETKILELKPAYHTEYENPCGAATGQITYHNDGSIYTCNEAMGREEFKLGNVFEDCWKDIFSKKETQKAILNSMLESNVICDRCSYKPYCSTCMVENYYNFNKFNFYPTKTQKHNTTIYQSKKIFDNILKNINLK